MWGNLGVSLLGFTGAIYVLDPLGHRPLVLSFGAAPARPRRRHRARHARGLDRGRSPAPRPARRPWCCCAGCSAPGCRGCRRCSTSCSSRLDDLRARHHQHRAAPGRRRRPALGVRARRRRASPRCWRCGRSAGSGCCARYVTVAVVAGHGLPRRSSCCATRCPRWATALRTGSGSPSTPSSAWRCRGCRWRPTTRGTRQSVRGTVVGTFVGYSITQIACYGVGLVALVTVARRRPEPACSARSSRSRVGTLAFAVLAIRELDQSFVDTYSTAVSVQNLRPRWDRRVLAVVIGALATVLALALERRRLLELPHPHRLGVRPAARRVRRRLLRRSRGAAGTSARRPGPLADAAAVAGGLRGLPAVNPGYIGWWARLWSRTRALHFTPPTWMSASLLSFAVAARRYPARRPGSTRRTTESAAMLVHPEVAEALADRTRRSWRWRARSSATGCPVRTTCASPARSRTPCGPAARSRRRSRSSTGRPGSAWTTTPWTGSPATRRWSRCSVRDIAVGGRPAAASGATTVASTAHLAAAAGIRRLRHRRARRRAPRRARHLGRVGRPHHAVAHPGAGGVRRREVDPRRRRHAGTAGDPEHRRARLPHRPLPRLLPARLGPRRCTGRSAPPAEVAAVLRAQDELGSAGYGLVLANPIAAADELDRDLHDRTVTAGLGRGRRRRRRTARTSPRSCSTSSTARPTGRRWPRTSRWCCRTRASPAQVAAAYAEQRGAMSATSCASATSWSTSWPTCPGRSPPAPTPRPRSACTAAARRRTSPPGSSPRRGAADLHRPDRRRLARPAAPSTS